MVPKVTPLTLTLAPFAFCPGLQAVCEINVPNNIQPSNTEVVKKCTARRRCCCSPGKCLMSWAIWATNAPSRIITSASGERSAARYAAVSLLISCSFSSVQGSSWVPQISQKALQWRYHRWQGQPSLHNECYLFQLPGLLHTEPRGECWRHFCKSACLAVRISPSLLNDGGVGLFRASKIRAFLGLACNVKPQKQRAAVAEDCQGRFMSLRLLHKQMQLVLSQRLFDWFCSPLEPFLNNFLILLYANGDDWADCSNSSRFYNDFGVQGKEAFLHRLQIDFQLSQKKQQELEGFLRCMALLMVIHALLDVMLC